MPRTDGGEDSGFLRECGVRVRSKGWPQKAGHVVLGLGQAKGMQVSGREVLR